MSEPLSNLVNAVTGVVPRSVAAATMRCSLGSRMASYPCSRVHCSIGKPPGGHSSGSGDSRNRKPGRSKPSGLPAGQVFAQAVETTGIDSVEILPFARIRVHPRPTTASAAARSGFGNGLRRGRSAELSYPHDTLRAPLSEGVGVNYEIKVIEEHGSDTGLAAGVDGFHESIVPRMTDLGVPSFVLTAVLTNDLASSVVQRGELDFTAERLGGSVTGKTLDDKDDYSEVTVVIDTSLVEDTKVLSVLHAFSTVAHEYGHVIIGRLRAATTGVKAPERRNQTPAEAAAATARRAVDELHCDLFANNIFSGMTVSIDGSDERPLNLGTLVDDGYHREFAECLDKIFYPGLPDLVMDDRLGDINLVDMYGELLKRSYSIFILAAHTEATAIASGEPNILTASRTILPSGRNSPAHGSPYATWSMDRRASPPSALIHRRSRCRSPLIISVLGNPAGVRESPIT